MATKQDKQLSRRERQIMDILYEHRECSAHDVRDAMPDAPSYSAVRALLAKMVEKGHIDSRQEGARYIYQPIQELGTVRKSALQRLVKTFFGGSAVSAATALLGMQGEKLEEAEIAALEKLVAEAKKRTK